MINNIISSTLQNILSNVTTGVEAVTGNDSDQHDDVTDSGAQGKEVISVDNHRCGIDGLREILMNGVKTKKRGWRRRELKLNDKLIKNPNCHYNNAEKTQLLYEYDTLSAWLKSSKANKHAVRYKQNGKYKKAKKNTDTLTYLTNEAWGTSAKSIRRFRKERHDETESIKKYCYYSSPRPFVSDDSIAVDNLDTSISNAVQLRTESKEAILIECVNLLDTHDFAPICPPSKIGSQTYSKDDINKSRQRFKELRRNKFKNKRKKHVPGALNTNIFISSTKVYDAKDFNKGYDFCVKCQGIETFIKYRDLSAKKGFFDNLLEINKCIPWDASPVRVNQDNDGIMQCFGQKKCGEEYVVMGNEKIDDNVWKRIETFCIQSSSVLDLDFKEEINEIKDSDMKQNISVSDKLGGKCGVSAFMAMTKDYCNASHFDHKDATRTIVIYTDSNQEQCKEWYFLFPNVMELSDQSFKAVAIKLFHGCVISFDAKLLRHCTVYDSSKYSSSSTFATAFIGKQYT